MREVLLGILVLLGLGLPFALRRRVKPRWLLLGALGLGVCTAFVARHQGLGELRAPDLARAHSLWQQASPRDYTVLVHVRADRLEDGHFEIHVRNGAVTLALQNGIPTSGSGEAYSIAGLFDLLQRELELAAEPDKGFGAPAGYRAYLRVRFHPQWGYPERYRRSVGGTSNGVEIRVESFAPAG